MVNRLFNGASACFAAALALALPFAAKAVDYTGTDYAPWSYSAGCVVWRASSGQLFHKSTVADVASDGTIGATYDLDTTGHPWQVFASNQSSAYTTPGMTLVFDEAGYNNNSDAQFAPMSFGGLWVKALQADGTPYCITDNKTDGTDRTVELGATGASSYFKFDKSFTFNRNSATKVLGSATVEIASGATFTINARANKGASVESGATLALKGAGTLAVTGGLTVAGTLDLTAATLPTIDGDVALAGTIVLPAGTQLPYTVCSGTLSGANAFVKIGDDEAVEKSLTISGGKITALGDPVYTFTADYPTVVPAGKTYTFVGGDTSENAVVLDALDVRGTLKTQGYFSFTNYKSGGAAAVLDVESGSLTLSPGNNRFNGTLTVEAGATFVNVLTDAVQYGGTFTANIYGTLDMGSTRWSLGANNTINLYAGCAVTGSGDGGNGTLDWIDNVTSTLNVYGDITLQAPIRIRGTTTLNVNVDTGDQAGLTLAGTIGTGKIVKKGAGLVNFTTNPSYAITVENGAFTFAVDATPTITYSAKPGTGTSMSMWYASQSTWKGTVVLGVLSAPASLPLSTYGNANSKIVMKGTTGSCYLSGGTIASELVIDTEGDDKVEFNNGSSGQTVTFTKVSGSGTLKLVAWAGCSSATYNITTFDGFTGTLAVENGITRGQGGTFTIGIGDIVTATVPTSGDCVLPIASTAVDNATGTVVCNLDNATLNGVASNLVVKSDGIYKGPTATITYPDGTTEDSYADLNTLLMLLYVSYTPAKAGAVVTVLDGSDETFVDSAEVIESLYDYDPANHTYTLKTMVASVTYVDGGQTKTLCVPYIDVVAEAAVHYDVTATLLVDLDMSSLESGITIPAGLYAITFDLGGKTITGPANGYAFVNGGGKVTITGEGTVAGAGIVSNATSSAVTVISNGTYSATGDLFAKDPDSSLTVSGGTFNKTFDETYLDEGMELHGNNGGYDVREAKGWVYEAAGYKEYTGTWSGDIEYDATTGKARIENGNTYTASAPSAGRMVTLDMTFGFDAINEEDDDIADAKAAVRLGAGANADEFVFQLYTSEGGVSKWVDVTAEGVTATTNVDFNFVFVLDMTNRTYTASVGGVALTSGSSSRFAFAGASATAEVRSVEFTGAGLFTSLIGSYEELVGFAEGQTFNNGAVTLTGLEADWLNGQNNFAGLSDMLNSLTQKALDTAYLLNLNVLDENYDGSYTFTVTNIEFGKDGDENETVVVTVGLTRKGALDGGINGTLKLKGGTELGTEFSVLDQVTIVDADFSDGDSTTCTFQKGDAPAKFYQAVIEPVIVE